MNKRLWQCVPHLDKAEKRPLKLAQLRTVACVKQLQIVSAPFNAGVMAMTGTPVHWWEQVFEVGVCLSMANFPKHAKHGDTLELVVIQKCLALSQLEVPQERRLDGVEPSKL